MISSFDLEVQVVSTDAERGFAAIASYARRRFAQVAANPPLARVMFAEELFMDDPEFSELLIGMMHQHKATLACHFAEAQACGELRGDIPEDQLFRLIFGPVRLLIKQWGMTDGAFDLVAKGDEMLDVLGKILC